MQCSKCQKESVVFQPYSGLYLCRSHFTTDLEAKAKRDIRTHRWLRSGDHIGILVQEDTGSLALVHFLTGLVANRRDVTVTVILPGKGAESCDSECFRLVAEIAGKTGIETIYVPEIRQGADEAGQLAGIAERCGITKYATAECLDDAALETLVSFLTEKTEDLWGNSGKWCTGKIPVMTPFISVPASEVELYAELVTGRQTEKGAKSSCDPFTGEVMEMLEKYTARHPATKYSLMHLGESIREAGNGLPGNAGKVKINAE